MAAIFEEVCERVIGCTFALQPYPEYLNFSAAMPFSGSLIFSMPPSTTDQGSPSGPP